MESINQTRPQHFSTSLSQSFQCEVKHFPIKRIFDVLFSSIVLILISPLIILLILLIKISCPGKTIYSHERIGRGGKRFKCYKFRTMYPDADKRLNDILKTNPELQEEWNRSFKLKNDPRVTPLGRLLRRTSLDELPQFWNVLKGDLSVVGPRPVVKEEIDKHFGVKAYKILSVRPGITGLWQVSGRSDTTYENRIKLEEQYVDTQSFFRDLKLVLKTIPCMLYFKGAY